MTRLFSLAALTVLACTPPEATRIAAETGYDFVSFRNMALNLPGEPIYDFVNDKALFRETRVALRETGMKALDLEVALLTDGIDVASYAPAMEAGAELGAKRVIANGWSNNHAYMQKSFERLCDLAAPLGLSIDVEFVTFNPVGTLAQVMDMITKSGRKNAGVLIDSLHFDRSHVSLAELDAVPRELFHFSQLRDAPTGLVLTPDEMKKTARGECLYLGEGGIPIKAMLSHMPDIPLSLEVCNPKRAEALGYREFARKCLETAKQYFAAA